MVTRRLHIRDLCAEDLPAMTEMWTDPDVGRFMGTFGPRTAAQTAAWLDEVMCHNRAQPRLVHDTAIIVAETGQCAGWIGCGPSDEPVGEYDFAYALRPAWRGYGYAREALTAMLAFFLRDLAVSSVWGQCDAGNHRSAAVMRAAGMTPIEASAEGDPRFRADHSWRPPRSAAKRSA